jgi:DNA-binding MarR family transcriptional regulator
MMSEWKPHDSLIGRVFILNNLLQARSQNYFKANGLGNMSLTRVGVLALLGSQPRTPSELADQLQISRPSLAEVIRKMEAEGLLARRGNPADARSDILALTSEGMRVLKKAQTCFQAAGGKLDRQLGKAGIDAAAIETTRKTLEKLIRILSAGEE